MRLVALAALALVVVAPASAATVTAQLTTSTRAPYAGEAWRYTVTVRIDGKPVAARMRLQVLAGRTVVGCWKRGRLVRCGDASLGEWIAFRGRRTGVTRFTAGSVGTRLTFRAVVESGGATLRLHAPVTVRRGAPVP